MTAYDFALFLHMAGLISMFGGFAIHVRAGARLRAATGLPEARSWLELLESSAKMFPAGTMLLLFSGLYMTFSRWTATRAWIVAAFTGLLTIWIIGSNVAGRHLRTLRAAVDGSRGTISVELSARIADPLPWTVLTSLNGLAFGIVFVMSMKPGWVIAFGAEAAAAAVGALIGSKALRRRSFAPTLETRPTQF
jgi:hypothetical protein